MRTLLCVVALAGVAFADPSPASDAAKQVFDPPTTVVANAEIERITRVYEDTKQVQALFDLAMAFAGHTMQATDPNKRKDYLLRTVKTMKKLVDDPANQRFDKLDVALFHYGVVLERGKYLKETRQVFDKLLKDHPQSPYAPIALLAYPGNVDAGRVAAARWVDAGAALVDLARETSLAPERARAAALAGARAYTNALGIDPSLATQAGTFDITAKRKAIAIKPPTAIETALFEAFAVYATVERNSRDAELGKMRFLEATLHRRRGDHASAVPLLVDYVHWNRDADGAELAAQLLLDSLLAQNKRGDARELAQRFLADEDFVKNKPDLGRAIEFVVRTSAHEKDRSVRHRPGR
jgi:hypothetical protein